ncbi:DeoR/GlpR family DNA-binding transcription regulator [Sinomicrobium weinanense]|uniref:DeoR/GlpR transcriptional regulator n=1 Tax=Sinomicrobium weinanense TaxID=2842200 RepID=A0A926JUK5_9FLAO|nr:DeoR/GlpR family DNA-binding transcription regulator [Sinomicrobium weinanense]MBC9797466.1 DeoR/GlpR transcriptional regulator [Sinomicrobium weinanense]MBU3124458.1 DeoR/GlpR family DNA-binding transcription regulator [Sinomicrobium weinanense]
MLKEERQQLILQKVNRERKILSKDLSEFLKVSEDTVRRDLNELAGKGMILKVHGGALATRQKIYTYDEASISNLEEKKTIAEKAVSLIRENHVIIVTGGTTNFELVSMIPDHLSITVYTYSLSIAMILTEKPNVEVLFIGGKLLKNAQVTVGIDVIKALSQVHADLCFLGTSALSVTEGLTEINYEVSHVKKAMIEASDNLVLLCTEEKLNMVERYKVCPISRVGTVVTSLSQNTLKRKYANFLATGVDFI